MCGDLLPIGTSAGTFEHLSSNLIIYKVHRSEMRWTSVLDGKVKQNNRIFICVFYYFLLMFVFCSFLFHLFNKYTVNICTICHKL